MEGTSWTAHIREGIRKMGFSTILDRWDTGEMTQAFAAYSLQARGRSERLFAIPQDRLPQGAAAVRDRHQSRRPTHGSKPTTSPSTTPASPSTPTGRPGLRPNIVTRGFDAPACHYDQNRLIFLLVLRPHHPLAVLGAENVIMHVGDPLPA